MDVVDEIVNLLEAKKAAEGSLVRRHSQIRYLWLSVVVVYCFIFTFVITGTLWYSKVERACRAVEKIYSKVYGSEMP